MVLPPLLRPGGLGGTRRKHRLGFRLATRNSARFRRRRRGAFSPPHLRRNQRLMIPIPPRRDLGPLAMDSLGPYAPPLFKGLKCYRKSYICKSKWRRQKHKKSFREFARSYDGPGFHGECLGETANSGQKIRILIHYPWPHYF